jgi:hypothetical protein
MEAPLPSGLGAFAAADWIDDRQQLLAQAQA